MQFKEQIDKLKQLLVDKSGGNYYVVGHKKQHRNSSKWRGLKHVQVSYSGGTFPKSSSAMNGESIHSAVVDVYLMVVETATVDLSVILDENSTSADRSEALAEAGDAESRADDAMDELFGYMYGIIQGADGEHFGDNSVPYTMADRWTPKFEKDPPARAGSDVIVTGSYQINFNVVETPNGETPTDGSTLSGTVDIQDGDGDSLLIEQETRI